MEPISLVSSTLARDEEHPFQSISGPLTFNTSNGSSMQYRSSTSSGSSGDIQMFQMQTNVTFGQKDSNALSFFVPSQVHKSAVSMGNEPTLNFYDQQSGPSPLGSSPFDFSLNATFPKSKCPQTDDPFALPQEPLNLSKNPNIEKEEEQNMNKIHFPYCNPLNSYIVDMASHTIMEVLHCILTAFTGDLDFTTNVTQCRIDGLVFISHQAVYFMLNVHGGITDPESSENSNTQSTVEYRRSSGNAMASSTFWNYLKRQIQQKLDHFDGQKHDEIPMEMDIDINTEGLDPFPMDGFEFVPDGEMHVDALYETDSDIEVDIGNKVILDQITESIKLNDQCLVEELRCLYQEMTSSKRTGQSLCDDMLHHKAFLDAVTGKALLHKDICISRFAVLILQQIAEIAKNGCGQMTSDQTHSQPLFENINKLLCCHSKAFIKKQAIRFLDQLSVSPSWNIQEIEKSQLMWRMQQYTKEYVDDEEIQRSIKRVVVKLSGN